MVQNAGSVEHLPRSVFVFSVTNEQVLSRERIRLHIDISLGHIVDEG